MSLSTPQREALRTMLKQAAETPARPTHRVLVTSLITLPVAAALVVAGIVVPGATSAAQAAEGLRSAADVAITTSDPFVGPGQFLKLTTEAAYLAYESDKNGYLTAYLSPSTTEVWIPGESSDDWVQRTTVEPASEFYGAPSEAAAKRDWAAAITAGVSTITRAANGEFVEVTELGGDVDLGDLPDTPETALAYLRSTPDSSDRGAFGLAAELLRSGTTTAVQRAVLYKALALLPSIRISDDAAVLDGRTGIAFTLTSDGQLDRIEIVIDPLTGLYIGERQVSVAAAGAIPANTTVAYTAVLTEVVNSAP